MSDDIVEIVMQSRPEPGAFGPCYECKDDRHRACVGLPCACPCPVPSYLLFTTSEQGWGEVVLWWKPEGAGYTRFLDEAGIFTRDDALSRARPAENVHAVPFPVAYAMAKKVVPYGPLVDAAAREAETDKALGFGRSASCSPGEGDER